MSEFILSKRLGAIASFVRPNSILADIGTDHGYLPVSLVSSGIISKAFACDINEKPLEKAKNLIFSTHLEDKIKTVLSDGLNKIENLNINEIVIAGMGYDLIIDIISRANWLKSQDIHIILQPMSGCEKVRHFLFENGFFIEDEKAVFENGKHYSVLSVFYNGKISATSDAFLYCGTHLKSTDKDSALYIDNVLNKLKYIHSGLLKSKTSDQSQKALEVQNIIDTIKNERIR